MSESIDDFWLLIHSPEKANIVDIQFTAAHNREQKREQNVLQPIHNANISIFHLSKEKALV